jgi:acyl carrier protein
MDPAEILNELTTVLRDTLGNDTIDLTMETVRSDVSDWDSFTYIVFMVAVQSKFGVKFKASDIEAFANVGEVVQKILDLKKLS